MKFIILISFLISFSSAFAQRYPPGGSGVTTLGSFGSSPNSFGASITGNTLTMQPADSTHPGELKAADWVAFNAKQAALTFSLPLLNTSGTVSCNVASGSQAGCLSSSDWTTFNSKQSSLTIGNLTDVGTDGITVTGGTGSVIGSGTSLSQHVADTTHNGYLLSTDWNTFNGKQAAGNYITALTGDGTASGPGSSALTLATVNSNVGSFNISNISVNAKGLVTAASAASTTGSGNVVLATSPTLVTPALGTPSALVGTNITGTASGLTAGTATNLAGGAGGSIPYQSAAATTAMLANGSAGQVLVSAGGTSAPVWQYPTVNAKTSAYNIAVTDRVLTFDMSGSSNASYATTLPTAAGNTGVTVTLVVTKGTGVLSLATTSAQTVGGFASSDIKLASVNDSITVVSDGANWQIQDFNIYVGAIYSLTGVGGTIASGTLTYQDFANKVSDPLGLVSGAGGGNTTTIQTGWRFIVPYAGHYQMCVIDFATAYSVVGTITGYICQDASCSYPIQVNTNTTASTGFTPSGCIDIAAAKSDTLQNGILQSSGSNRTLAAGSIISVRRVGN